MSLQRSFYHLLKKADSRFQFPLYSAKLRDFLLDRHEFPFLEMPTRDLEASIAQSLAGFNALEQREYLMAFDGCFIEPEHGWALTHDGQLIAESYPYALGENVPHPLRLWFGINKRRAARLESAISIRYYWGNYFHFFNDIWGALLLCDKMGLSRETPILVPAWVRELSYFQAALRRVPELRERNWIYQGKSQMFWVERAYFSKNMPSNRAYFETMREFLKVPPYDGKSARRVFITRNTRQRFLSNAPEIEAILRAHDFQMVDCAALSLDEQIELFAQTQIVAGVHGAGLTNVWFMNHPRRAMLEIFPSDLIPPHYYWLGLQSGVAYFATTGTQRTPNGFYLEPEKLRVKLKEVLAFCGA